MRKSSGPTFQVDRERWPSWVGAIERVLVKDTHRHERRRGAASMSPGLTYGRHFGPPLPDAYQAAVLVLVVLPDEVSKHETDVDSAKVLLTVRAKHLKSHPGQVSFPGGRKEPEEELHDAALREFEEELGLTVNKSMLIGEMMPLFVYASNHYVQPFLAVAHGLPAVRPSQAEVDRVIQLPIGDLRQENAIRRETYARGLASWTAPTLHVEGAQVWGATAMMLGELVTLLQLTRDWK